MSSLKTTLAHLLLGNPQKSPPDTYIKEISRSILVDGVERVLSNGGTDQYNRDGTGDPAYGFAALNFARIVFSMEQGGLKNTDLLQAVLSCECAEETTAICALWPGDLHLGVEDICRIPLFEKILKPKTTTHGRPEVSFFESLLTELNNLDSSAVVIITRPPEIIACLKLQHAIQNVFIIFDSHPRPSYPNGAGMIANTSIEGTAHRLSVLLPNADLSDSSFPQWQTRLQSIYSGHVFVPRGVETPTPTLRQAALESSLAQLSMQVENSELLSQIESLKNEQLESEAKEAQALCRFSLEQISMQAEISELRSQNVSLKNEQQRLESKIKKAKARSRRHETLIQRQQQQQFGSSSGSPKYLEPSSMPSSYFSLSTRHTSRPSSSKASNFPLNPFSLDFPSATKSSSSRTPGHSVFPPIPHSDSDESDDSIFSVMRLQHEYDIENRALSAQRADLAKLSQRLFVCGICLEEMLYDSVARPDPCRHTFCRECLRGHVAARLNERKFPVLCPTCTADKSKGKGIVGEVSQSIALNLGLTNKQYRIWTEMEMVGVSVPLNCRECKRTMFVDRDEYEEADIIECPLPDCDHAWCKQCQQSVDFDGPEHSCDGTLELDDLMKKKGWKYCPTCKTPIQKRSGCNHMTCPSPACNTHFCYVCGGLILKSALGKEVEEAVSAHYRKKCQFFKVPAE